MKKATLFFLTFIFSFSTFANSSDNFKFTFNFSGKKVKYFESVPPPAYQPHPNFKEIYDIREKRKAFALYLKPYIDYLNQMTMNARNRLMDLNQKPFSQFTQNDSLFLREISQLFSLPIPTNKPNQTWFDEALSKVDIIPPDLIISQAGIDSQWGELNMATAAYNYFAVYCETVGCGIVPPNLIRENETSRNHKEAVIFKSPYHAIRTHYLNLNANSSYRTMRQIRSDLRRSGKPITAIEIADGLINYSILGREYVRQLKTMLNYSQVYWLDGEENNS